MEEPIEKLAMLEAFVALLTRWRPVVIAVEDAQWMDRGTKAFLSCLLHFSGDPASRCSARSRPKPAADRSPSFRAAGCSGPGMRPASTWNPSPGVMPTSLQEPACAVCRSRASCRGRSSGYRAATRSSRWNTSEPCRNPAASSSTGQCGWPGAVATDRLPRPDSAGVGCPHEWRHRPGRFSRRGGTAAGNALDSGRSLLPESGILLTPSYYIIRLHCSGMDTGAPGAEDDLRAALHALS